MIIGARLAEHVMKISATEEYGLRCIMHVARQFNSDTPVTAQEVATAEGISAPYAQKLLRQFARAELIESRRGVGGGYVLARHPHRITVLDIVRALDAEFETTEFCARHTGEFETCAHACNCTIRPVWSFIEDFVSQTLSRLTLDVLVSGNPTLIRELIENPNPVVQMDCPVENLKARYES